MARSDGCGERGGFWVSGDELDVLNAGAVGDRDGGDDLAGGKFPEAQCVGLLDAGCRGGLEDGDGYDEVAGQYDVLVEVDAQAVGRELLAKDVEGRADIFGPLVDDVEVCIGFDEAAR